MTLLSVRGLTVRYPESGVTALDGLDLDLARGETLALVGESGSGKSQVALAALGAGAVRSAERCSGSTEPPDGLIATARRISFRSCRTLPGHQYRANKSRVCELRCTSDLPSCSHASRSHASRPG